MLKNKLLWSAITVLAVFGVGCRYDMQDQPRYKAYKESNFFNNKSAMRDLPEGTVPRGMLREDKAFYTGKLENAGTLPAPTTVTDASGNTIITSFPGVVDQFPVPVTKELVDRGEQRYKVFCIVCHGPTGNGDGMIVRRGFVKPPTYNDDRLRNAPVGHFFDVITNGFGRMNSYAAQVPPADRWAIVAYIRALQISQNPNGTQTGAVNQNRNANATTTANQPRNINANTNVNANTAAPASAPANTAANGGAR